MQGFGLGLGLTQRRAGVSNAAILALFSNGEQGAWYDPSDLTTMFQDAAGTTPVTADGQPVGLALDKRLWGGKTLTQVLAGQPELVPNGDFSGPLTGWTFSNCTGAIVGGQLVLTSTASSGSITAPYNGGGSTVGARYMWKVTPVSRTTTTNPTIYIGGNYVGFSPSMGAPAKGIAASSTASQLFAIQSGITAIGQQFIFDDVSVKLIPGNHSQQSNVAARRTYKTNGTLAWLWDDNSDDAMPVTFGNLGSNCTVAYATASGVTILTAQTISGVYNVPGKGANLYGCIIIDRALTPSETASVTAWLKKKAGL